MRRFVLDTNVVSEPARKAPNQGVLNFLAVTPELFVSVIVFHELAFGLEAAPRDKKARLAGFLERVLSSFGATAVPVDMSIAETAGRLRGFAKTNGRMLTISDSLMAATAVVKNAELVTRNTKDFQGLDIPLVNPFIERN
jgi:toxin FitB